MKGRNQLRKVVSFLIVFAMMFSFMQFNIAMPANAAEKTQAEGLVFHIGDQTGDIVPVDRDPKNTDSLVINNLKMATQYTLDSTNEYVLTNVQKISGGDGVTISDPIQNGSKYRYTISNIQNYNTFKIKVSLKKLDTGEIVNHVITVNFVSDSSLEFGKIGITFTGSKNYTADLFYGNENENGEYRIQDISSGIKAADIKVYAKDNKTPMPVKINGQSNSVVQLEGGENVIKIEVTSNSLSKIYTLVLDKQSDARLKSLVPSTGTLSPSFDSETQSYTLKVPTTTEKISFTPTAADSSSTIKVKKSTVASGKKSAEIKLEEGDNRIPITVTNKYGSYTYDVVVTRTEQFRSTALTGLRISSGTLSPTFNKEVTEYSAVVENSVTSITVTPTAEDKNATIKVQGKKVPSGAASANIGLDEGGNTITVIVTDTKDNTQTYTINVSRRYPKNNVNLSSLSVTDGKLSPIFDPDIFLYTARVDRNIDNVRLKFATQNDKAKVKINGVEYTNGQSDKINLKLGANTVTIEVTAEDGKATTKYSVSIIRDKVEGKYDWVVENGYWTYYDGHGTKVKNDWVKYENQWYYMDLNGYRQTGWKLIGDKWYCFNDNGIMITGWYYSKGYWYYLQENDGSMITGIWKMLGGNWYLFNGLGEMQTGWQSYKGNWYYLSEKGVMQKGWVTIDKNKYYFNDDGSMRTGWLFNGKVWYYFDDEGQMRTGWQTINGKNYYFDASGAMKTTKFFLDGRWIDPSSM